MIKRSLNKDIPLKKNRLLAFKAIAVLLPLLLLILLEV